MLKKLRDSLYRLKQKRIKLEQVRGQLNAFKLLEKSSLMRFQIIDDKNFFIFNEDTSQTFFDRHYIYHTAWAFRKILEINPEKLSDFSSSLYFIGMISSLVKTDFYDIRPPILELSNLDSFSEDLTQLSLPSYSLECVSCMHVVEHIGLGRYGDKLDYDGDLKAIKELKRIIKIGGHLLFVIPIGAKSIICFNSHRIYSANQIISSFSDQFELLEFTLITETHGQGNLIRFPSEQDLKNQNYGCGCFHFKKVS